MTKDEIMVLDLDGIEKRTAEINNEIDAADAMETLDALKDELTAIEERKAIIAAEIEKRKTDMKTVAEGAGKPIEVRKDKEIMSNIEVRNTPEYINAFAEYIKTGKDMECRALLTENVSGTVPVPEFVYDIVKTAWEREEVMALVNKTNFRGNLKIGFEISGGEATVHTEGAAAVSEEELVLGIVELVPASIKKWINYQVA